MYTKNPERAIPKAYQKNISSNKPLWGCRKKNFIERVHADDAKSFRHPGVKIIPPVSVVEECDMIRGLLFRQIRDLQMANETTLIVSAT